MAALLPAFLSHVRHAESTEHVQPCHMMVLMLLPSRAGETSQPEIAQDRTRGHLLPVEKTGALAAYGYFSKFALHMRQDVLVPVKARVRSE